MKIDLRFQLFGFGGTNGTLPSGASTDVPGAAYLAKASSLASSRRARLRLARWFATHR
jgi:hypothetical protein